MKEILLKLKKTFWKLELIYLIIAAAFIFGGLSFIPQVADHFQKLWNVIWNCSFGTLFLCYFLTAEDHVRRELIRFRFYIAFAIMMVGYVIVFSLYPLGDASVTAYIITFVLCELIIIFGIYYSWKDYKKEKYLATKCKGKGTVECNLDVPCVMCQDYRGYMTNDEISAAIESFHNREKRRWERKQFFKKLRGKE